MRQHNLLTNEELSGLKAVRSDEEWDAVCRQIQAAHGGRMPTDWWESVIQSGLAEKVMDSYGARQNVSFHYLSQEEWTGDDDN